MANRHVQWAAQFAVASELSVRGNEVAFTLGQSTPEADLFVKSPRGIMFQVDVKGMRKAGGWNIKKREIDVYIIFVVIKKNDEKSEYIYSMCRQGEINSLIKEYRNGDGKLVRSVLPNALLRCVERSWSSLPGQNS